MLLLVCFLKLAFINLSILQKRLIAIININLSITYKLNQLVEEVYISKRYIIDF